MATDFTPGPYFSGREANLQCGDWQIDTPGSCSYRYIAAGDDCVPVAIVTSDFNNDERLDANTALFLAAPDLHEAVSRAARMFRHYEALHRAKGTKDGDDKAASNAGIAEFCEAALAKANGLQKAGEP